MLSEDATRFIQAQTVLASPSILPELTLYLATEVTPLWQATEDRLQQEGLPPPFWAFAWPGGQGVARYLLDHPALVAGKRVVDFAAGSGLGAIAAMKAGASSAWAVDIDPLALEAVRLNAAYNQVRVEAVAGLDVTRVPSAVDVILAGDVCYAKDMSATILGWLHLCVAAGLTVLLADPGRAYAPEQGLRELARYEVPTSRDLEDRDSRTVTVWQMVKI